MLQSVPRLRFNKEGNLLAVSTADNGFKILATTAGLRSLRAIENPSFEALRTPVESAALKVKMSHSYNFYSEIYTVWVHECLFFSFIH